ncbi:MAG TPA: S8 family peptidase [Solirubrobacteraceae bacterium]|nr:S8 family peptidase [Solirubrobacteraceae bacterium]
MTRSVQIVERMRWMSALAGAAVAAIALAIALGATSGQIRLVPNSSGASTAPGSSAPLDPRIATLAAHRPSATVQAIVQFNATVTAAKAKSDAVGVRGRVIGNLPIIHGLALSLTAAEARSLATNPDVHAVSLNTTVTTESLPFHMVPGQGLLTSELQTTYDETTGVTSLWRFGVTGTGVGVAVVDTGVDGALPDFATKDHGSSRVVASAVANADATTATDSYGHGTDVAGIIAGNGDNRATGDPLHGHYIGVAPNANLISIKVSDETGKASVLDVIYGLQFAVEHQSQFNIRVINLSLNSNTPQSYKTDPLDAAVEAAWMHGIVVVASAGNQGTASGAVQYAPANDPYVITVGGVDENGSSNPSGDTIASWSSQGTTQDGLHKPDVYAPGAHIVSVLAPGSYFASSCATCVVGNGQYIQTSGTSMAAPVISGLVADLLQIHPNWTPDQVKGALTSPTVTDNSSFQEPNAVKAALLWSPPLADQGLTPSTLIDTTTGNINYNLSSWNLSSWNRAKGPLRAGFALSSWNCSDCTASGGEGASPTLGSWNVASWSTVEPLG